MRQLKKIIGMVLVLALTVCSIASCDKPEELIPAADEFLASNPYTVDVRVAYTSDNEAMAAAIASFTGPTMKVSVDGDKFSAIMYLKSGDDVNYVQFTFIDGYLYTEYSEDGKVTESKTQYTAEDIAALRASLGAGANVTYEDFEEVDVKGVKELSIITCEDIKSDAIASLTASLSEQLKTVFDEVTVTVYTATLNIEIENERYNVIILNCTYFITTPTDSYSIDMKYSMKFNYSESVEITAPSFS